MKGIPGPATFQPEQYRRHFTPAHIVGHVLEVLEIIDQIEEAHSPGIPMDLRPHVFGVVQAMVSSMEPKDAEQQRRAAMLGLGEGVGVRGLS